MSTTNALHVNGNVAIVPTPFTIDVARGILPSATVRPLTLQLDRHTENRIAFLNGRIVVLFDPLDLPRHPSLLPSHEGVLEA